MRPSEDRVDNSENQQRRILIYRKNYGNYGDTFIGSSQ